MSAARGQALLTSGSLLVCAALLSLGAPAAFAQSTSGHSQRPAETVPPGVKELWSEYPLDPRRQSGRGGAERSPTADEEREAGARKTLFLVAAALAGVLSVLGVALFRRLQPAATAGRTGRRRGRRLEGGGRGRRAPRRDVRAVSTREAPPQAERLEAAPAEATYVQVGEEVTALLASARQEAEEIRTAARGEAELIRAEADRKAAAVIAKAELDAEVVRSESDDLRAEADRYQEQVREAANQRLEERRRKTRAEAERRQADAERQAGEIRRAVVVKAKALEVDADERRQALIAAAEHFEARLQQLLKIFHEMTSRLDELLPPEHAASADAELERMVAESLDEALTQRS
jgi:cell division septum initiation protein DivIVA